MGSDPPFPHLGATTVTPRVPRPYRLSPHVSAPAIFCYFLFLTRASPLVLLPARRFPRGTLRAAHPVACIEGLALPSLVGRSSTPFPTDTPLGTLRSAMYPFPTASILAAPPFLNRMPGSLL